MTKMKYFWGKTFPLQFVRLYNRYKNYKRSTNRNWMPPRLNLIGQITIYLAPAIVIFIFFPAMLFTYFEGWDYTISIYYAFVTLTTIGKTVFFLKYNKSQWRFGNEILLTILRFFVGFGDYVPTFQPHQERSFGIYFVLYQLFIIAWFIIGTRPCFLLT